ncbi:hypothetical protein OG21DRAFT_100709 [Imleria badia]|nr:hypothetical protein OG21DRAFT_100709 [Imleria badia]
MSTFTFSSSVHRSHPPSTSLLWRPSADSGRSNGDSRHDIFILPPLPKWPLGGQHWLDYNITAIRRILNRRQPIPLLNSRPFKSFESWTPQSLLCGHNVLRVLAVYCGVYQAKRLYLSCGCSYLQSIWLTSQITAVVIITAVIYDYSLTLSREIDYVWSRPWTRVSTMFVLVRYVGLCWAM